MNIGNSISEKVKEIIKEITIESINDIESKNQKGITTSHKNYTKIYNKIKDNIIPEIPEQITTIHKITKTQASNENNNNNRRKYI